MVVMTKNNTYKDVICREFLYLETITTACMQRQWLWFMMTSSNRNIFYVFVRIPITKASDVELRCFYDPRLSKRLSKQSGRWWFEMPSRSLHNDVTEMFPGIMSRHVCTSCLDTATQGNGSCNVINLYGIYKTRPQNDRWQYAKTLRKLSIMWFGASR